MWEIYKGKTISKGLYLVPFIFLCVLLSNCNNRSKNEYDKKVENELKSVNYYTISNSFGDDTILKNYDRKDIIIENIILDTNINGVKIFIGNIMGSKSAVLISMYKNKIILSEEIGYIKSCTLKNVDNIDFVLLTSKYEDVCEYIENTIIYSCYSNNISMF